MAIYYDDTTSEYAISPDNCGDCGESLYDTGCDAPGCTARCCMSCGTGCDIEIAPDDGQCATALSEEGDGEHEARVDRERAAFGLAPLGGQEAVGLLHLLALRDPEMAQAAMDMIEIAQVVTRG